MPAGEQAGTGGASLGTYGDLAPYGALTAITYRLGDKLCQRGPVMAPGARSHVSDPCATPSWPAQRTSFKDLHLPLSARLDVRHGLIKGVEVSFEAPFAIADARHSYGLRIPMRLCGSPTKGIAYSGASLDENVARGATVKLHIGDPFADQCGRRVRKVTVLALYEGAEGSGYTLVGAVTLHEPPGSRPAPPPRRHPAH
jgi:hypothetical protein